MNQQMTQGMAHLSSMMPSQDERRMAQLESAIASALQRMAQYKALGMDTSAISRRITALENELNGQIDAMFKL
jgi:predicted  nucleic acid-binding Zn-ribbon protein